MNATIERPKYESAPLAIGLTWKPSPGVLYTEKLDGCFAIRQMHGATFVGEAMRDGSFHAFDVVTIGGDDVGKRPLRERWAALQAFKSLGVAIVPEGKGGAFLQSVLSRGGEGIIAADLDARYGAAGGRWKCKREETHDCTVSEINRDKTTAHLFTGSTDRGWCKVKPSVRVGDVIEVRCHAIHVSGRFREAVFLRVRKDKTK